MYGSATLLVYSTGNGVNEFTLDPSSGEFVLTKANIRVKSRHNIYSVNEVLRSCILQMCSAYRLCAPQGNTVLWSEPTKRYVQQVKFPPKGKPYSLRYVGSMVADVHRTLVYGGIFMYPADSSSKSGKLRLLYEANPMSFLMEQAGGKASTGTGRVLEVVPTSIHQRVPIFIGSKENVEDLEACFRAAATAPTARL